ncbi:MAG: Uma2 family endonuclease [Deltaproteobacteria bacterium]|nr:Uma2 family endonuclease [Deltaproteobacteria bacterium]
MEGAAARRRATYQDVLDAPSHMVAEVLDGVLHVHPRPAFPHALAHSALGGQLGQAFWWGRGGPGGWIILDEPELHLGSEPDIVVPDLAGWRNERLPVVPRAAFVTLAPDWVCEVISPSTADVDRAEKVPIYARERVAHVWLLDPLLRTLEVLRLDGPTYRLVATWRGDATVRAEPFDAIELDLGVLWARVAPEAGTGPSRK